MRFVWVFSIVFDIAVFLINLFTYHKYKSPDYLGILAFVAASPVIGFVLCLFISSLLGKSNMKETVVNVDEASYIKNYFLLDNGTVSHIKDTEGNIYNFSSVMPVFYDTESPHLIIWKQPENYTEWFFAESPRYELHLTKEKQ